MSKSGERTTRRRPVLPAVPVPAEISAVRVEILNVTKLGGPTRFKARATLPNKSTESKMFTAVGGDIASAYQKAREFLERYKPRCPECGTYFAPTVNSSCRCGRCFLEES